MGGGGDASGGNVSDGEWQMKLCSLALCRPVPNRLWTATGPRPGGWGPPDVEDC